MPLSVVKFTDVSEELIIFIIRVKEHDSHIIILNSKKNTVQTCIFFLDPSPYIISASN
jgi:hypothetical protein